MATEVATAWAGFCYEVVDITWAGYGTDVASTWAGLATV